MQLSAALFLAGRNPKLAGGSEHTTRVCHEIIAFPDYYLLIEHSLYDFINLIN